MKSGYLDGRCLGKLSPFLLAGNHIKCGAFGESRRLISKCAEFISMAKWDLWLWLGRFRFSSEIAAVVVFNISSRDMKRTLYGASATEESSNRFGGVLGVVRVRDVVRCFEFVSQRPFHALASSDGSEELRMGSGGLLPRRWDVVVLASVDKD
jgi:hypothetical protein